VQFEQQIYEPKMTMEEAQNLRRQAKRGLRLAESLSDRYASQALEAHARTLVARAEALEQEGQAVSSAEQPQQQQQGQPPEDD